ncbi:MAG: hypothetical protein ACTSWY_11615 [Promethearchaeota archaeon]
MNSIHLHLPSEDEINIIKIKKKVKDQLFIVISNEEDQTRLLKELADRMINTAKEKKVLLDLETELLKDEEIAVKNPSGNIKAEEFSVLKKSVSLLKDSLNNQEMLADSFFNLSSAMRDFLKKKREYHKIVRRLLRVEQKWQKKAYRFLKRKNRYISDQKLMPLETKLRSLESKRKRLQSQTDRNIESLMIESRQLDLGWTDVKNNIKKYGW